MSRAEHFTTRRRRVLSGIVPSVLGMGLAAVLVGCGAGQITQTANQQSAVNGASGTVGAMAIRDAQLAYPGNQQGTYAPGSTARMILTIVNTGVTDDTLVRITSPAVTSVTIDGSPSGSKVIPGGFSVSSGLDTDDSTGSSSAAPPATSSPTSPATSSPTSPAAPASPAPTGSAAPTTAGPLVPGKVTIDLVGIRSVNGGPLRAGLTIPMTFYFAHAGRVTLAQVPIGAPADSSS